MLWGYLVAKHNAQGFCDGRWCGLEQNQVGTLVLWSIWSHFGNQSIKIPVCSVWFSLFHCEKKEKCGNWGSNSVPTPYESVALPSELFPHKMKAPGSVDRTRCLKIIAKSITVSRSTKWAKPGEGMGGDGTGPKTTEVWFEHTRHKAKWFLIILVNHFDIQPDNNKRRPCWRS